MAIPKGDTVHHQLSMDDFFEKSSEDATIKFPNSHAQGEFSFAQKDVLRGGKRVKMNAFTVNAAKVSDASLQLLQRKFAGKFNYYDLRKQAEKKLQPFFGEHKLLEMDISNKRAFEKNKRMMNIMIEEEIKSTIKKDIQEDCIIKIPFDDFFGSLQIDSIYKEKNIRFNRAIELVLDVQSSSYCDYRGKRVEIGENGNLEEIGYVGKSALVPTIEFEFDEAIGDIKKIEDLVASKKRNKAKYIKFVVLKFDVDTFASLVSPGREYTLTDRNVRNTFESISAFRLDTLVRSIEKIQHYTTVNHYTLDDLNRLFGVNYKTFFDFKRRILRPGCDEFNKCDDLHVDFKEHKKNNAFSYISFSIVRKENILISGEYKVFDLAYYIAVQHYYFDDYIEGETNASFLDHYQEIKFHVERKSNNIQYCFGGDDSDDLTLESWEKEYLEASECYEKLIIAVGRDQAWFKERKIKLCTTKLCFIEEDTGEIYEPYKGLFHVHNPIKAYKYYLAEKQK